MFEVLFRSLFVNKIHNESYGDLENYVEINNDNDVLRVLRITRKTYKSIPIITFIYHPDTTNSFVEYYYCENGKISKVFGSLQEVEKLIDKEELKKLKSRQLFKS